MSTRLIVVLAIGVLISGDPSSDCPATRRVECQTLHFAEPPRHTPSSSFIDAPYMGDGNVGVALGGPPESLVFFFGSNNMWSTNTAPNRGLCNAAVPLGPTNSYLHADNAYTQITIGTVTVAVADLKGASFSVDMDYANALINGSFVNPATGLEVNISTFVVRGTDGLERFVVDVTASADTNVTVTVNNPGRGHWGLDAFEGRDNVTGFPWASRNGVTEANNNLVLSPCGNGGQHNMSQLFTIDKATGDIGTADHRNIDLAPGLVGESCGGGGDVMGMTVRKGLLNTKQVRFRPTLADNSTSTGTIEVIGNNGIAYTLALAMLTQSPSLNVPDFVLDPGVLGSQTHVLPTPCVCSDLHTCVPLVAQLCKQTFGCGGFAINTTTAAAAADGAPLECQMYDLTGVQNPTSDHVWTLWRNMDVVGGYYPLVGDVGGQPPVVNCNCTTLDACPQEASEQCNATANCAGFAVFNTYFAGRCQLYDQRRTQEAYPDAGWNFWAKGNRPPLPPVPPSPPAAKANGPYIIAQSNVTNSSNTNANATIKGVWLLRDARLVYQGSEDARMTNMCLTIAEPNPQLSGAIAVKVLPPSPSNVNGNGNGEGEGGGDGDGNGDGGGGNGANGNHQRRHGWGGRVFSSRESTPPNSLPITATSFTVIGKETTTIIAGVHVCCDDCAESVISTPSCPRDNNNNTNHTGAVSPAITAADVVSTDIDSLRAEHQTFWETFWLASEINLGPTYKLLEQVYYGFQYMFASGTRGDAMPPGLWGPWITTDSPGWNGDYTLNYNFEAIYYGAFSSNHAELVHNYFDIIDEFIELGRWRVQLNWSDTGQTVGLPGQWANIFAYWPDADGVMPTPNGAELKGINFPGHFSPFKHLYFPNDMGQKSDAAFTALHYCHYFDYTNDVDFLRTRAYPFLTLVSDFYETYATWNDTTQVYEILNSCAMEECYAQGLHSGQSSNNPPFDLGPAKYIFNRLSKYSEILGVDVDRRAKWKEMGEKLAPFPTVVDPVFGKTVIASHESMDPAWFPNPQNHGNARYPIVFFMAIHPGEGVSLSSPPELLQQARDTVNIVNNINLYRPINGLCMAWPPASRVAASATSLLANFTDALTGHLYLNNWPMINDGCPMEQAGATEAINGLLMSSHEGFIRLFSAGWPRGETAAFTNLRAEGAFLVSANVTSSPTDEHALSFAYIQVQSLQGLTCSVLSPFGGSAKHQQQQQQHHHHHHHQQQQQEEEEPCIVIMSNSKQVPTTTNGNGVFMFNTTALGVYTIHSC